MSELDDNLGHHGPKDRDRARGEPDPTELRALLAKATAGPWVRLHDQSQQRAVVRMENGQWGPLHVEDFHAHSCDCGQVWSTAADWPVAFCDTRQSGEGPTGETRMANAALIVAAVNALPELLSALDRQAKELEGLREARDRVLAYRGPKWPDEMTLREKVRFEFTGDINKPECPPDQDPPR